MKTLQLLFLFIIFNFFAFTACPAKTPAKTTGNASDVINRFLTPEKIFAWEQTNPEKLKKATEQSIFWKGKVLSFQKIGDTIFLKIKSGKHVIEACGEENVRNLDYDRTGFTVGLKGKPVIKKNKFYYFEISSIILMDGPPMRKKLGKAEPEKDFIYNWIEMHNPHYSESLKNSLATAIIEHSKKNKLPALLVTALITIESAFDTNAVSGSGAIGLGQIMPLTAKELGIDPEKSTENIKGCCNYLGFLKSIWNNKANAQDLILASYNAGPGNVKHYQGIPPFAETKNYVYFINTLYHSMQSLYKTQKS